MNSCYKVHKRSEDYRDNLIKIIRKEMIDNNPLVSLNDISKITGCSTNTISSYYISIRRSKEWKDRLKTYCQVKSMK